jgi:hypothetical protein
LTFKQSKRRHPGRKHKRGVRSVLTRGSDKLEVMRDGGMVYYSVGDHCDYEAVLGPVEFDQAEKKGDGEDVVD